MQQHLKREESGVNKKDTYLSSLERQKTKTQERRTLASSGFRHRAVSKKSECSRYFQSAIGIPLRDRRHHIGSERSNSKHDRLFTSMFESVAQER